jgi:hypothetical protein
MKSTFTIITSTFVTLSPTLSLSAFAIYGGKNELFDFICFLCFGATCYALAHLQPFSKGK